MKHRSIVSDEKHTFWGGICIVAVGNTPYRNAKSRRVRGKKDKSLNVLENVLQIIQLRHTVICHQSSDTNSKNILLVLLSRDIKCYHHQVYINVTRGDIRINALGLHYYQSFSRSQQCSLVIVSYHKLKTVRVTYKSKYAMSSAIKGLKLFRNCNF